MRQAGSKTQKKRMLGTGKGQSHSIDGGGRWRWEEWGEVYQEMMLERQERAGPEGFASHPKECGLFTEGNRKPLKVIKLGHETCECPRDACCHGAWAEAGRSTPSP